MCLRVYDDSLYNLDLYRRAIKRIYALYGFRITVLR